MRSLALISSFLIASTVFAQAPAQDWRFAHPGATLVGGFRLKAVLNSPLMNSLIAQATTKDPSTGMMVGMIRSAVGGVTEVRFSVRDMGKGKEPDVLALVTGVVDDAIAGAITQGKPQDKTEVRRIDANTLLIGEGQSLDEAVARMSKPATGLQARALDRSKTLADHDLWIAGTIPEIPNMTIPMLESLRGLALGISLQSDLKVEVALDLDNAKTAEDLVSSVRRSQVKQPGLGAALQSEADGSTAHFRMMLPGDQVIQAVKQGMEQNGAAPSPLAGLFGTSFGSEALPTFKSSSNSLTPAPAAPPKQKQGTIKIYGLDEGTREIQTQPRQ